MIRDPSAERPVENDVEQSADNKANESARLSSALPQRIRQAIANAGGWLPFDAFMNLALYAPGLGYYSRASRQFGAMPESGSDFVTAPELSPLFGTTLAAQVLQALQASEATRIVEFGAGSGALALQLLDALGDAVSDYAIVELSGALRARQQATLARHAPRVRWLDAMPSRIHGVVVGNEVLDAMPVTLLRFDGERWFERGVVVASQASDDTAAFAFADRPTTLRPPVSDAQFLPGALAEIHPQGEAFVRTLAESLERGAALFIDYGFPEHEYYHRQRHGGTLMAHRAHVASTDVLALVGEQDITAHVNFSAMALAAQDAGLQVDGYTSQARLLLNCGLLPQLAKAAPRERVMAQKLIDEHEMGELFKVLCLSRGLEWSPLGFAEGDRSHRL